MDLLEVNVRTHKALLAGRGDSPVAGTKFPHAAPELSPEQHTERDSIRIADFGSDPIHTAVTRLQEMHSAFDAQILEVRQAGPIAAALMANASELLAKVPQIEQIDLLAVKLAK